MIITETASGKIALPNGAADTTTWFSKENNMANRTIKYEVRWDNGSIDYFTSNEWGSPEKTAEAARNLINHWTRFGIYGTVIQVTEEPIYRSPTAPDYDTITEI